MGLGKPVIASRIAKFQELGEVSDEILVNPRSIGELSGTHWLLLDEPFQQYIKERVHLGAENSMAFRGTTARAALRAARIDSAPSISQRTACDLRDRPMGYAHGISTALP